MDDGVRWPVRAEGVAIGRRPGARATWWPLWIVAAWTIVGVVVGLLRESLVRRSPSGLVWSLAASVVVQWFWVPVTVAVIVLAARRSAWQRPGWSGAWEYVAASTAVVLLEPLWTQGVLRSAGVRTGPYIPQMLGSSDTNVVFLVAIVAVVLAGLSYRATLAAELTTTRLAGALAGAQVQVLTMQLQPHFLFNTLHLVSEEMFEHPADAKRTLADLRSLLTQSFAYAAQREVTLADELGFLDAYVAIQDRRFRGRLSVTYDIAPDARDAVVPHLLLQPLVENAIRHGIAPRASGGAVCVRVQREGDRLRVTVEDDGVGLAPAPRVAAPANGLGVTQTQARLAHLYGADASLTIGGRAGGGAVTRVDLPYRLTAASAADDAPATSAVVAAAPRPWSRGRVAATVVIAWVAIAVLWSQLVSVALDAAGEHHVRWFALLAGHLVIALTGAALSWPALRAARAVPMRVGRIVRNVGAHAAIGIALASVHAAAALGAFAALASQTGWAAPFARTYRGSIAGWMMWDVIAYLAVVAFLNRMTFAEWHRQASLESERLRVTVAQARLELVRLQFQPAVLLAGLDAVARAADVDPDHCEDVIARFGDLLREMLAGTPVTLDAMQHALEPAR